MDSGRKSEAQRFLRELQDKAFFKERKRIESGNAEKTARLKALRLAKEEQELATAALEVKPAPSRRAKAVKKPADDKMVLDQHAAMSPIVAPEPLTPTEKA